MRTLRANASGEPKEITDISKELLAEVQQQDGLLWLDLGAGDDREMVQELLASIFGFHPLAIDDALNESHAPKVDDWESYLYVVVRDATFDEEIERLLLPELDIFLGDGFLVTYHKGGAPALDSVWSTCQRDHRWLQHGADHLVYRVMDEIANNYTNIVEAMEDELAELESTIFRNPAPDLLQRIFTFKRTTLRLRRVLAPQRDVVNRLARDRYAVIGPKDQLFFRDVYDHIWRLYDLSDNLRDLVMGSMDIYLSVVNNQMNDIMKRLTLITTVFMPLTVLTGFFGMNFFAPVLPSTFWTGRAMLLLALAIMVLLPLTMYWWMRRQAWTAQL